MCWNSPVTNNMNIKYKYEICSGLSMSKVKPLPRTNDNNKSISL